MQIAGQRQVASQRAAAQAASNRAAGRRQAAALSAQRSNSQRQIQAQSQRQSQAADQSYKRMYIQAGLQEEFQEDAYDREIQKMEEQARQKAGERKMIYSEEGKRRIAEGNRIVDYANDPNSPLEPGQRAALNERGRSLAAGTPMHSIPSLVDKPPEGFAPYESGTLPNGMGYLVGSDGKITTQPYEHTKEGYVTVQRIKQEEVKKKEAQTYEAKRQSMIQALIGKSYSKQIPRKEVPGTLYGTNVEEAHQVDAIHTLESATRQVDMTHPPSEQQQRAALSTATAMVPGFSQTPQAAPATQPQQQVPPPQRELPQQWWTAQEFRGVEVLESEKRMPRLAGIAKAGIRTLLAENDYREENMSPQDRRSLSEMRETVRRFQEERTKRNRQGK
jgi:hypothetical protein